MQTTPKSLRLQIGIFGRTNTGKSSFLNMIVGQDISIISPIPGTTTDVVEKVAELLPIGPVVFLDTAGIDDTSALASERIRKTVAVFDRADVFLLLTQDGVWGEFERFVYEESLKRNTPLIVVVNKADLNYPSDEFLKQIREHTSFIFICCSTDLTQREECLRSLKQFLIKSLPDEHFRKTSIIGDIIPSGGLAVMIVPIDLQAPKGRLILPQVQTIRDALDNDASALIVKETEYKNILSVLNRNPDLVICDSQVVTNMVDLTPGGIPCTTFSILFARLKGDLVSAARGAATIQNLKSGDRVLISESCTHHATEDDIGRVKIPRWLNKYKAGMNISIDVCSGRDYPRDIETYALIIHCGGCMITRKEMLSRIDKAGNCGVPVTNYGLAISCFQGVVERVLEPFPAALNEYITEINVKSPKQDRKKL
ncbi:Fe-only hydrogenase maturation protein HydF [Chitinispirillum alkaliphilum]|nr:Fe-only hydrogenase maturation protein HydF [Chitinispirillum alkaliphilum]